MPKTINFLSQRAKKHTATEKQDRVILNWSLVASGVITLVSFVIVGTSLWLASSLANLEQRAEGLERSIAQSQDVETSFIVFITKLQILNELMESRSNKQEAIAYFSKSFPETVEVSDVNYNSGDETLSLNLETTDIFSLRSVFDQLDLPEVANNYASIDKGNIMRSDNGGYSLNLIINLPVKAESQTSNDAT